MRIKKIVLQPAQYIQLANNKKYNIRSYIVSGHGGGIHIPTTTAASFFDYYEAEDEAINEFIRQLRYCIENKKTTPSWKHDSSAGYCGVYISLPKTLITHYNIELPQKFKTYSTVFCDLCLEPVYEEVRE